MSNLKGYLIAVDLDDTLVTGFSNMDVESFDKLKSLAKDNTIIIATGRPNRSSINFYNYIGLDTILINYNGAWIHNPKDPSFTPVCHFMKKEYVFDLIRGCRDDIVNIFSEIGDDIYLEHYDEITRPFLHEDGANLHIGNLEEILPSDPAGAIVFAKEGSQERLEKYVDETFKGEVLIRLWNKTNPVVAEFYTPQIDKGMMIERIRQYYNIDKEKTIAFGDGHNDIQMITSVRYGVAMANSHPALLEVAKYVTSSVYEHGVKVFLEKLENGEIE